MFVVVIRWILALFALGSGAAKLYGIEAEQAGADQLGVPYLALRVTGVVHVVAGGLLASGRPIAGGMLLAGSYAPFVYLGFARDEPALGWGAAVLVVVSLGFSWGSRVDSELTSPPHTDRVPAASQLSEP